MSAAERDDDDGGPLYLHRGSVGERLGYTDKTVKLYVSTGELPEPDLVFLGRYLWLPETIDAWRENRYYRDENGNMRRRIGRPRRKVEHEDPPLVRPPRLVPSATNEPAKPPEPEPEGPVSSVSARRAANIAAKLRAAGSYCTSADVQELADHSGEGLERERAELRRRIRSAARIAGRRRR